MRTGVTCKETVVAISCSSASKSEAVRTPARSLVALFVLALIAGLPGVSAAQQPDPGVLRWFHTYNVPGDYAVGGVDLKPLSFANGLRTRRIAMGNQVPANAEILAAFLYWETMWRGPQTVLEDLRGQVKFRGEPVTAIKSSTQPLTPGCRAIGNGEWISIMRADVLRLLPPQLDENGSPTGRRLVNDGDLAANGLDPHTVTLPDSGIFNFVPQSAGASLLVIYQDPNPAASLTSVVVYDGIHVQAPGADTQVTLRGLIDVQDGSAAKLTHIGGSGLRNITERVFVGNRRVDSGNPFPAGGLFTDRAWSNPTFSLAPGTWTPQDGGVYGEQVTTKITHALPLVLYDCLSTGAVVFSTRTQDGDGDGLPDKLEDAVSEMKDPSGLSYPNIHAMGASSDRRDLFVEINAMHTPAGTVYGVSREPYVGTVIDTDGHTHMPTPDVLYQVGHALAHPPLGHQPIAVHFDVGPGYHSLVDPDAPASDPSPYASNVADAYIIDASLARGGELIKERASARFPDFPGTVSWNSAYQILASAPVGNNGQELSALQVQQGACLTEGSAFPCRRRFDLNRHGIFHLGIYVHARGVPKSTAPCLLATGEEAPVNANGECDVAINPAYYVPKSVSGVAELPGKFFMVSLGLWDNFKGTAGMQANTTLHELGHNLDLWHGGGKPQFSFGQGGLHVFVQPNCKPNHLSVMSYLFQATGVRGLDGLARPRLSGETIGPVDEQGLVDGPLGLSPDGAYTSWYAPKVEGTSGFKFDLATAERHCDGTPLLASDPAVGMVRLDAKTADESIDWTGAAGPAQYTGGQDVNFDGKKDGEAATLVGYNDWDGIALNRLGSGFNIAGFSQGLDFGGLDFGGLDFGGLDFGGLDFGGLDFGGLDFGGLDFGGLDFGGLDFGGLDFGGLDFGGLDFGGLDFGGLEAESEAELTYEIVLESIAPGGSTPPNALTVCVIGVGDCVGEPLHRQKLDWDPPTVGSPDFYQASRAYDPTGAATEPALDAVVTIVGTTPADGTTTTLIDPEELPDGKRFIYWVRASVDEELGSLSNFAFVTAVNSPPVATSDQGFTLREDTYATFPSVLGNDTDEDSAPSSLRAVLVAGTQHGSLVFNADGTFTYTPEPDFFGTDTFTYRANNGVWSVDSSVPMSPDSNVATVTIVVTPVNDAPAYTPPAAPNQEANQNAGQQTVPNWATNITARPPNENDQALDFIVTNNNPGLFAVQPAIAPDGTLTYTPKPTASGVAIVTVQLHDNGGTADDGADTSAPLTFTITVNAVALTKIQAEKAEVWFSTSKSSTTKFDLKAEVLKNGTVIASGTLTNTTLGYGESFAKALYKQIGLVCDLTSFSSTDTLKLRISIRLSNVYGAPSSAATKLYYNVPTTGHSSDLRAKRNFVDVKYFMVKGATGLLELQKNGTVAGPTQAIDFTVTSKTTYMEIATFSVTGP